MNDHNLKLDGEGNMETNIPQYWNEKYRKDNYAWGLIPSDVAIQITDYVSSDKYVLDIGCGCGRDSLYFSTLGANAVGTDWAEEGISQARQLGTRKDIRGSLKFTQADFCHLLDYFDIESFDIISSYNTFHLLGDAYRCSVFDDYWQILKPGGIFAFEVFSIKESGYGIGDQIESNSYMKKGQLIHFYTDKEIFQLTKKFKVITLKHIECSEDYPKPHKHQEWLYIGQK